MDGSHLIDWAWLGARLLEAWDTLGWAALAALGAAPAGWVASRGMHRLDRLSAAVITACVGAGATFLSAPSEVDAELVDRLPAIGPAVGYRSSDACGSCHPGEHASWHRSFHRTMTQVATPEAIVAPFDGRVLSERGRYFSVFRNGDAFYASEVAPNDELHGASEDVETWQERGAVRRVVMTTGSHHMQAYWTQGRDGHLEQLPFVYLIREERWLANSDSFLGPPPADHDPLRRYVWSEGCVACHSTGGPWEPRAQGIESDAETAVAELGIACEACHGPGAEHVEANRSPGRRYALHRADDGDPTIVNPARLDAVRSASVCGHCHSVYPDDVSPADFPFRPGERLDQHLDIAAMLRTVDAASEVVDVRTLPEADRDTVEGFWTDGSVRVAGREYTGLLRSPCHTVGGASCTSCHRLHGGTRAKQMDPEQTSFDTCGSCHESIAAAPEAHTHHAPESIGSECVSCHMPYTSYALLMATRSHGIDNPSASGDGGRARPNACNLCHLDRSIGWTADRLTAWYGQPRPTLSDEAESLAAGAVWMLRGDGVQRALAAWHMGWEPARRASDEASLQPALVTLLGDPYSAVRQIASTSLMAIDPSLHLDRDAITADAQPNARQHLATVSADLPESTIRLLWAARNDMPASIPE